MSILGELLGFDLEDLDNEGKFPVSFWPPASPRIPSEG